MGCDILLMIVAPVGATLRLEGLGLLGTAPLNMISARRAGRGSLVMRSAMSLSIVVIFQLTFIVYQ